MWHLLCNRGIFNTCVVFYHNIKKQLPPPYPAADFDWLAVRDVYGCCCRLRWAADISKNKYKFICLNINVYINYDIIFNWIIFSNINRNLSWNDSETCAIILVHAFNYCRNVSLLCTKMSKISWCNNGKTSMLSY